METRTNSLLRSVFIVLFVFYQCFKTSGKQEEQTRTGCRRIKLADGTIVYSKDCKFDGKVVHKVEKCTNPPCKRPPAQETSNTRIYSETRGKKESLDDLSGEVLKHVAHRSRRAAAGHPPTITAGRANIWIIRWYQKVNAKIGDRISVVRGTEVTIFCPVTGDPEPVTKWYVNGKPIDYRFDRNYRVSLKDGGTELKILNVVRGATSEYVCEATNEHGKAIGRGWVRPINRGQATILSERKIVEYDFSVKKASITIGTNLTIYEKANILLRCPVKAFPSRYDTQWDMPSKARYSDNVQRSGKKFLILRNVKTEFSGIYSCRATSVMGGDKQQSVITILGKMKASIKYSNRTIARFEQYGPNVTINIGDTLTVASGATVRITCPAVGPPKPSIVWKKRGLTISLPTGNLYSENGGSVFVIDRIKEADTDTYSCVATNLLGSVTATAHITVTPEGAQAPTKDTKRKDSVDTLDQQSKSVTVGSNAELVEGQGLLIHCPLVGKPAPKVDWFFNKKPLSDKRKDVVIAENGKSLFILEAGKQATGRYTCKGSNILGTHTESTNLKILDASHPVISASSNRVKTGKGLVPISITIGDDMKTSGGRQVHIRCPVSGSPQPKITWDKDGKPLKFTKNIKTVNTTENLVILEAKKEDSGKYSCYASNAAGVATTSSRIKILPAGSPVITSFQGNVRVLDDQEDDIKVPIGTKVTTVTKKRLELICPFEGDADSKVVWQVDDQPIVYNNRIKKSKNDSLIIEEIEYYDAGTYSCRVYNRAGKDIMRTHLQISSSPHSVVKASNKISKLQSFGIGEALYAVTGHDLTVSKGHSVQISCPVRGSPRPMIRWFKNGKKISVTSGSIVIEGETISLDNVGPEDGGVYTCAATSPTGTSNSSSRLTVINAFKPIIRRSNETRAYKDNTQTVEIVIGSQVHAVEGLSLKISCPVTGTPNPTVTWYFNNAKLKMNSLHMQDKENDALIIPRLNPSLQGGYTCRAENSLGEDEASSSVSVMLSNPPKIKQSNKTNVRYHKRKFTYQLTIGDSLKTTGGHNVLIHCIADGTPKPSIMWEMNSVELKNSSRVYLYHNGTLGIEDIKQIDSGLYKCVALNSKGVDTSASRLVIRGSDSPIIVTKPKEEKMILDQSTTSVVLPVGTNLTTLAGKELKLTCPVRGSPVPKIKWFKDGTELKSSPIVSFRDDGTLIIKPLQADNGGKYTCSAENNHGSDKISTVVKVTVPAEDLIASTRQVEVQDLEPSTMKKELSMNIGSDATVLSGKVVVLRCPTQGSIKPKITWYSGNKMISSDENHVITDDSLIIKEQREGVYDYKCKAETFLGSTEMASKVKIVGGFKPTVRSSNGTHIYTDNTKNVEVMVGSQIQAVEGLSLRIACPSTGAPKPTVTWYFNNVKIKMNGLYMQDKENDGLIIPRLNPSLQGSYVCRAENSIGRDEASSSLSVMSSVPPKIKKSNKSFVRYDKKKSVYHLTTGDSLKTTAGHDVLIECTASGTPEPNVIWEMNSLELKNSSRTYLYPNGTLRIEDLKYTDSGLYKCMALNSKGVDTSVSLLVILGSDSPIIVSKPKEERVIVGQLTKSATVSVGTNLTTLEGKELKLTCPVKGTPKPKIKWYKDGIELKSGPRITLKDDGILIITKLEADEAGKYTCSAENKHGSDKISTVVKVTVPPKDLIAPVEHVEVQDLELPTSKKKLSLNIGSNATVISGKVVVLRCPTKGSVKPNITWYSGNKLIVPSENYAIRGDSLVIAQQREGEFDYKCKVETFLGETEMTSKLKIVVPQKPVVAVVDQDKLTMSEKVRINIGGRIKVKLGSQLDIKCPSKGVPPPKFAWFRNNKELDDDDDVVIKGQGSVLRIPYVRRSNEATYFCVASNGVGAKSKGSIKVTVYEPSKPVINVKKDDPDERKTGTWPRPPILQDNANITGDVGRNYSLYAGMRLTLKCLVTGNPKPDLTWLKDGKTIAENIENLVIENVSMKNTGNYICKAVNVFGTQEAFTKINVIEPQKPVIQRDPVKGKIIKVISSVVGKRSVQVDIGDNLKTFTGADIVMRCPAIGIPHPTISFYKDGRQLRPNENITLDNAVGILNLKRTWKRSVGNYTCRASNSGGWAEMSTVLQLIDPIPPKILEPVGDFTYKYSLLENNGHLYAAVGHSNASVYPGTIVNIDCPVTGFPLPDIIWSFNGRVLQPSKNAVEVKENGTLVLYYLSRDGQGYYECSAFNFAGGYTAKIFLKVTEPVPPKIATSVGYVDLSSQLTASLTIGQNAKVLYGAEVSIECPAQGEPSPSVIWSGEMGFEMKRRMTLEMNEGRTLKIMQASKNATGLYKCIAANIFGSDYAVSKLLVVESRQPVITSVKKNATAYNGIKQVSVVVGGHLDVVENTRVTIECPVSGSPAPRVAWLFNDQVLSETQIKNEAGFQTFVLEKVSMKDTGKYTCLVKNVIGSDAADTHIFVGVAPSIRTAPLPTTNTLRIKEKTITVPIGAAINLQSKSSVVIQCFGYGYPSPKIRWYKDGSLITGNHKYGLFIEGLLQMYMINAYDDGEYTCVAENRFGAKKMTSRLTVTDPPKIRATNRNITAVTGATKAVHVSVGGSITAVRGMSIIINCPASGIPAPKIRWMRKDHYFIIDPRIGLTIDNALHIDALESGDAGVYTCEAENKAGKDSASTKLIVAEPPFAKLNSPQYAAAIQRAYAPAFGARTRIIVIAGETIEIECVVEGSPLPKIHWYKNEKTITLDNIKYVARADKLLITNATKKDDGSYRCMAENLAGKNMDSVQVTVGEKPIILKSSGEVSRTTRTTMKVTIGEKVGVREGSLVMVVCEATGNPTPEVSWQRNGKSIHSSSQVKENNILLLANVTNENTGNYTCLALNEIGKDSASTIVSIIEPAQMKLLPKSRYKQSKDEVIIILGDKQVTEVHAIEGENVKIICAAQGFPAPEIQFRRNQHRLRKVTENFPWILKRSMVYVGKKALARSEGIMIIKNVNKRDFGDISCRVQNAAGREDVTVRLGIHKRPVEPFSATWVTYGSTVCTGKCLRANWAKQIRTVKCMSYGGEIVPDNRCDQSKRPPEEHKCYTKRCRTTWAMTPWEECSASCGDSGQRIRTVNCVFADNGIKVADDECRGLKPKSKESCNIISCKKDNCEDNHPYCDAVVKLGYCKGEWFQKRCCSSCRNKYTDTSRSS